jgi:hypothetical protein
MPAFQVVDADRPVGEVVDDVVGRIVAFVLGGPIPADTSGHPSEPEGLNEPRALDEPEPAPVPAPTVELAAAVAQLPIVDSRSAAGT